MDLSFLFKIVIAPFPGFLKRSVYRHIFGYKISKGVAIGLSVIHVDSCVIEDSVSIGHFNIFIGTKSLSIGQHTRIGMLNIFRGGDRIVIGEYCDILRKNEINSIPDPVVSNPIDPVLILGRGCVIAASHKIDFTDRVEFGAQVVLGGRNSSLWTHNRQATAPIVVGDNAYLGSEIRMAPGSSIPADCIVGMGAVVAGKFTTTQKLIGGVPAREIKDIDNESLFMIRNKTRVDLPDAVPEASDVVFPVAIDGQ